MDREASGKQTKFVIVTDGVVSSSRLAELIRKAKQERKTQDSQQQFPSKTSLTLLKNCKDSAKLEKIASTARLFKRISESLNSTPEKDDQWDLLGKHVAKRLRKLSPILAMEGELRIDQTLNKLQKSNRLLLSGQATIRWSSDSQQPRAQQVTPPVAPEVNQQINPPSTDTIQENQDAEITTNSEE
ncbi:hypothetical protein LSTR_LSTR010566 [Laodelphax striatellus]|uniref:Uncharacterized protein n=1 Tax=Laodelphax striatellus TaxID=195883 RepID=A0A482XHV1_LAOST|nr:hypothetical protein LSTR_LSTR010566 [Laodelphax striatellus]